MAECVITKGQSALLFKYTASLETSRDRQNKYCIEPEP